MSTITTHKQNQICNMTYTTSALAVPGKLQQHSFIRDGKPVNVDKCFFQMNLTTQMRCFFDHLEFPIISSTQEWETDQPLQKGEITDSIKTMQSGRAPRPDSFPIEFYKKFSKNICTPSRYVQWLSGPGNLATNPHSRLHHTVVEAKKGFSWEWVVLPNLSPECRL